LVSSTGLYKRKKYLPTTVELTVSLCLPIGQMKEIWNNIDPMTGREFGKAIEAYYGIRRNT
jgi:hypothetical protein